jgi:hypothetical protein
MNKRPSIERLLERITSFLYGNEWEENRMIYCLNTVEWIFELSLTSRRRRSLFKLKDSNAGQGGSWFVPHAIRQ